MSALYLLSFRFCRVRVYRIGASCSRSSLQQYHQQQRGETHLFCRYLQVGFDDFVDWAMNVCNCVVLRLQSLHSWCEYNQCRCLLQVLFTVTPQIVVYIVQYFCIYLTLSNSLHSIFNCFNHRVKRVFPLTTNIESGDSFSQT